MLLLRHETLNKRNSNKSWRIRPHRQKVFIKLTSKTTSNVVTNLSILFLKRSAVGWRNPDMFITLLRYTKSLQILPRMVGGERGACFEIRVTNLLLKIGCTRAVDVNARMFIYFYLLVVYGKLQPNTRSSWIAYELQQINEL